MLRIYDFRCSSGEVFEKFVDSKVRTVECKCGESATRMISPVSCSLDHTFPGEALKFAKRHEEGAGKKY